jgi:predicted amidohydrolase YtcJ
MADTAQPPPAPHADVLVHGGRIMTMDDANTVVDAVLIRSGRVVATGESARSATDVPRIDLDGRVAMPGLVDGHPHLLHLATRQSGYVDLGDAVDFADIVERFRAHFTQVVVFN